ncbi:26S proteasome non-ATPase regulatory subunit 12-like [Halichondria panicea]|uniref:26S proteasome non-ATPase regulatory subunit 12-like n=1 Tax=Halichondria panicea TaxID=6063 RepID=UPI00312BABCE
MADGRLVKMEEDYSDTVDKRLPECTEMAQNGRLHDALESLLSLEKTTRTANDSISTGRVMKAIVQLCFDTQEWDTLNEHILILTKRRNQLKTAVAAMVEECCKFVDQTPNLDTKLKLIDTLRTVSEGKIYVEVPRARLTMELAKIKEENGEVAEAAAILQELQVETFGSMEKVEKVRFILEQMRLCLAKKDYIRTQIISKKISTKFFADENDVQQELKLKYYQLMIELCSHDGDYLAICKHYRAVFNTPQVQREDSHWQEALKSIVLYVLLAPFDNEQSDLKHRIYEEKQLEQIPLYKEVLECFRREELLDWSDFQAQYGPSLRIGGPDLPPTLTFQPGDEIAEKRWEDFRKRVIEHNIRVIAKYYSRIRMQRLSELLALSIDEVEEFLSQLVTKKTIFARIDRPAGIVTFRESKDPNDVLNEWSTSLSSLMSLVSKTTHLINKEEMIHAIVK